MKFDGFFDLFVIEYYLSGYIRVEKEQDMQEELFPQLLMGWTA